MYHRFVGNNRKDSIKMSFFTFELVTPEKIVLKQEADQITLPTPDGEITLLPHHIPLVTLVSAGELRLKKDNKEIPLLVTGGYLEVNGSFVRLLTDEAEHAAEIDETKAEEARQRAEKIQQEAYQDEKAYAEASAILERSLARLRIAKKYRRLRRPGSVPSENE